MFFKKRSKGPPRATTRAARLSFAWVGQTRLGVYLTDPSSGSGGFPGEHWWPSTSKCRSIPRLLLWKRTPSISKSSSLDGWKWLEEAEGAHAASCALMHSARSAAVSMGSRPLLTYERAALLQVPFTIASSSAEFRSALGWAAYIAV